MIALLHLIGLFKKVKGDETLLDQSFSLENFRKIFDLENRKGNFLEGKYFPELTDVTFEIKQCVSDLRLLRRSQGNLVKTEYEKRKIALYEKRDQLKKQKEETLNQLLEKVVTAVSEKDFSFGISEQNVGLPKTVFRETQNPATFFVLKQLQYNIRKLYKVKQSNRFNIICQIRENLSTKFPKYYVKTDITSFYESIPRQKILKRLDADSLLTQTSKKFIRKILYEYEQVSGQATGLPRGIGISAYLAELYMREVDREIQQHQRIKFYVRYVDDIFLLAFPTPDENAALIEDYIDDILSSYELTVNPLKTESGIIKGSLHTPIEYLGYKFRLDNGKVKLELTDAKIARYKSRIDATFSSYEKLVDDNPKKARRILLKRIRFLTSNTRLSNNKRNIVTGIYFSNSLISNTDTLDELDTHLSIKVAAITHLRLQTKLTDLSFKDGYVQKRFFKFTAKELSQIVGAWKHVS